jgi:hypothetical protein
MLDQPAIFTVGQSVVEPVLSVIRCAASRMQQARQHNNGSAMVFPGMPIRITGVELIRGRGFLRAGTWKGAKRFLPLILRVYFSVPRTPEGSGK